MFFLCEMHVRFTLTCDRVCWPVDRPTNRRTTQSTRIERIYRLATYILWISKHFNWNSNALYWCCCCVFLFLGSINGVCVCSVYCSCVIVRQFAVRRMRTFPIQTNDWIGLNEDVRECDFCCWRRAFIVARWTIVGRMARRKSS